MLCDMQTNYVIVIHHQQAASSKQAAATNKVTDELKYIHKLLMTALARSFVRSFVRSKAAAATTNLISFSAFLHLKFLNVTRSLLLPLLRRFACISLYYHRFGSASVVGNRQPSRQTDSQDSK